MSFIKKSYKYIITIAIGLVIAIVIANYEFKYLSAGMQTRMRAWSDGFFFTGVSFVSIGLLGLISDAGLFNGLRYSFKKMIHVIKHPKKVDKNFTSYYDYVMEKEQPSKKTTYLCVIGVFFLLAAGIFLLLFYKV